MLQIDYYKKLGVAATANTEEIKAAFRRKIKTLHPDLVSQKTTTSRELSSLINAYETLNNVERRKEYDERFQTLRPYAEKRFNYRSYLIEHMHRGKFWGKLILFEFLHNRKAYALELFETYKELHSLSEALERSDYLDCLVFLGEEYLANKSYEEAYWCFEQIALEELKSPYFRHFMEEIYGYIHYIIRVFSRILAKERFAMYTKRIRVLQIPKFATSVRKRSYYEQETV